MKIIERGATKKRLKFCLTEEKQKFVALLDVRFSLLMQVLQEILLITFL